MLKTLRGIDTGQLRPTPQDNGRATLAPVLTKEDGRIDFTRSAQEIYNRMRGFQPWPGAFTRFRGKTLGVTAARPVQGRRSSVVGSSSKNAQEEVPVMADESLPGTLAEGSLLVHDSRLFVGCGKNTMLELLEVQPEGKKRMAARDFMHGYRPKAGEKVGIG